MVMKSVIYRGPHGSGVFVPDGLSGEIFCAHGAPTGVPGDVADELVERDDFDLADTGASVSPAPAPVKKTAVKKAAVKQEQGAPVPASSEGNDD